MAFATKTFIGRRGPETRSAVIQSALKTKCRAICLAPHEVPSGAASCRRIVRAQAGRSPEIGLLQQRPPLVFYVIEACTAQHQMSRWRGRLQRLDDGLGGPRWVARLFTATFYGFLAMLASRFLIVSDDVGRLFHGSPKICPKRAGLDNQDADSQRFDLLREGLRQAFDRKFRGRIIARAGKADDPAD